MLYYGDRLYFLNHIITSFRTFPHDYSLNAKFKQGFQEVRAVILRKAKPPSLLPSSAASRKLVELKAKIDSQRET